MTMRRKKVAGWFVLSVCGVVFVAATKSLTGTYWLAGILTFALVATWSLFAVGEQD